MVLSQLGQKPGSDYINASFVDVSGLRIFKALYMEYTKYVNTHVMILCYSIVILSIDCSEVLLTLSILRVMKSLRLTLHQKVQSVTLWMTFGG